MSQIRKVCTTLPPKSDWNLVHNPKIRVYFSAQFSPDAVGRRRPALRLRSFPRGCPPQANFFSKKNQNWWFPLRNLLFSLCLPLYFDRKFEYFMKNIYLSQNLRKFWKFEKIFETFWIKKNFEKKKKIWQKNWKKCKKKILKNINVLYTVLFGI